MDENMNKKMNEENLEEVAGGLNAMHLDLGGKIGTPTVMHPILNDKTDAENVHPLMNEKDIPIASHPVMKNLLGEPTLIDTAGEDKKGTLA